MKETVTIREYEHAMRNIGQLQEYRNKRGWTIRELSQLSGVSDKQIRMYETGRELPTIRNYNKLTRVFNWKKITVITPRRVRKEPSIQMSEEFIESAAVTIPLNPKYEFDVGKEYRILETEREVKAPIKDCVFKYEGKEGLHHMFREVSGKWTRTYTDAQLVGKKIEEV